MVRLLLLQAVGQPMNFCWLLIVVPTPDRVEHAT
jgi:hypothetical protein